MLQCVNSYRIEVKQFKFTLKIEDTDKAELFNYLYIDNDNK